ncbi:hypothetical protein [Undibacterium rugosum]|uniref:hypothetical protein n=1 Tax=Undibacterium rugosum TaxID=2762291 RepID=UPI001B829F3B|nr:hypothetical protein [Undibacterium rugosum]MBR7777389.1 hypothetical protein [Undibacterium rugosum]
MYPDPKRVRDNRITLRFDDYEHDLITALANYQGEQPSTLLRQLVLREAAALLGLDDADSVSRKSV